MIFWITLFLLVLLVSFILAYRSMADFPKIPTQDEEYGLFLIRNTKGLTADTLDQIHDGLSKDGMTLSFERLLKGKEAALTIFGPKKVLLTYATPLDILELDDYTKVDKGDLNVWEVAVKDLNLFDLFKNFPQLKTDEQFWWQLTLQAKKVKEGQPPSFQSQIRAAIFAKDPQRKKNLTESIKNLASSFLVKVPRPYSQDQIINFYKQRSFVSEAHNPSLMSRQILKLILLKS